MSVCLKSKSALKAGTWSKVFTSFNTNTKSCLFVKQLTHCCISTILHLRKILPDECFEAKSFEGMTLKLLKPGREHQYTVTIDKWLNGAFEAIEKKYLKHLMLDIHDADSKMTLEIYTMTFNYQKGNDSLMVSTDCNQNRFGAENTKLTTIKLLQMCYAVTQTYADLPSRITLSMRLSYHEGTPKEYQPSGYEIWKPVDTLFPQTARSIELGVTETQHHYFKLINKSCFNEKFFKDMESADQNSRSVASSQRTHDAHRSKSSEKDTKAKRELTFCSSRSKIQPPNQKNEQETMVSAPKSKSFSNKKSKENLIKQNLPKEVALPRKISDVNGKIRCPCLSSEKSEVMFTCLSCRCFVHAECFGILLFDSSKKIRFNCHICHKEGDSKCHDRIIVNLKNSSDQQKLAILRRILKFCTTPQVVKITVKKMEKIAGSTCPKTVVEIVLNKMIEIGVAIPQRKRKSYLIDKQELEKKIVYYFYNLKNCSQSQSQAK